MLNRPIKKVPSLRDFTVANLFSRTPPGPGCPLNWREAPLGRRRQFFSSRLECEKGETLVDTVNNILAMKVDMVVMRHPHPGASIFGIEVDVPIVNAGDGTHEHPPKPCWTPSVCGSVGRGLDRKEHRHCRGHSAFTCGACPTSKR